MIVLRGNRYALDNGFGYDLYENGRYVRGAATLAEADDFVSRREDWDEIEEAGDRHGVVVRA